VDNFLRVACEPAHLTRCRGFVWQTSEEEEEEEEQKSNEDRGLGLGCCSARENQVFLLLFFSATIRTVVDALRHPHLLGRDVVDCCSTSTLPSDAVGASVALVRHAKPDALIVSGK
jgi:hypothetical protein